MRRDIFNTALIAEINKSEDELIRLLMRETKNSLNDEVVCEIVYMGDLNALIELNIEDYSKIKMIKIIGSLKALKCIAFKVVR